MNPKNTVFDAKVLFFFIFTFLIYCFLASFSVQSTGLSPDFRRDLLHGVDQDERLPRATWDLGKKAVIDKDAGATAGF